MHIAFEVRIVLEIAVSYPDASLNIALLYKTITTEKAFPNTSRTQQFSMRFDQMAIGRTPVDPELPQHTGDAIGIHQENMTRVKRATENPSSHPATEISLVREPHCDIVTHVLGL